MIIVPTRHSALQIVNCLRSFMPGDYKESKRWKEFVEQYSEQADDSGEKSDASAAPSDEDEMDDEETARGKELLKRINENMKLSKAKHVVKKTGIDFDEWQLGNTNERFAFGVTVEKKLFDVNTQFNCSDIIIGSPMALKDIIVDKK